MILADYTCPDHGRFEATVPSPSPDDHPCPRCGASSPWAPAPLRGWVKRGEVSRGKSDATEVPTWMDTRELGEGMPMEEWQAKRDQAWAEHEHKENKELFG